MINLNGRYFSSSTELREKQVHVHLLYNLTNNYKDILVKDVPGGLSDF